VVSSVTTIVADVYRYVVGVDTHAATHSYAIVTAATGALIDQARPLAGATS
jgi:transposase